MLPKHPANERSACLFHATFALIGLVHVVTGIRSRSRLLFLAHVAGGAAMLWFHGVGAKRHYDDPEFRIPRFHAVMNVEAGNCEYPAAREAIKRAISRCDALAQRVRYRNT